MEGSPRGRRQKSWRNLYGDVMAIWDPADELNHPLDFLLIQSGFVNLFFQQTILEETTSWLHRHGYRIVALDATSWHTPADMHTDIAAALQFPGYYGSNLAALNDCLGDVAIRSYGWSESDAGLVLVVEGYDKFAAKDQATAHKLLDIYAHQASYAALFGHRLMCLVRSSDPRLQVAPVGGTPVNWNFREFESSKRQVD